MIPTPFRLVTIASLSLLAIPACTNEPVKKAIPVAGVTSYDHYERNNKTSNTYINQYKRAQITTRHSSMLPVYSQRADNRYTQKSTINQRLQHRPVIQKQQNIFAVKAAYRGKRNLHQTWHEIHRGFKLGDYSHKRRVQRYIRSYARMPEQMIRLNHRSSPYLPAILAELKRRQMPTEIALLPFVESAYQTDAYSPAKAAGLWQFIPATARRYGLPVTAKYDARYNWRASTNAALDYLQDLNREFNGDWLLSLAAYNCGEARVHSEIERNRARGLPTDFWSLRLPKETRHYVPRLLAFKEIYGNPSAHGVHIAHIPANPTMARSRYWQNKKSGKKKIAKRSNKHRKKYQKRIITHKVKRGETLFRIAKKYRTSVRTIMRLNKLKSTKITAGKRLKIATSKKRYYG